MTIKELLEDNFWFIVFALWFSIVGFAIGLVFGFFIL